jgi:hypothetical protein
MSAAELIKQVALLPPQERALFDQLFRAMENGVGTRSEANGANWPEFGQRLHDIYGGKFAPDSQAIIDEGRGGR